MASAVNMDLERRDFRAMILYDFLKGLSVTDCHETLQNVFGTYAPCKTQIYFWFGEFKRGRRSIKDETHTGRPVTVVNEKSIATTRAMIESDARVTYAEIERTLGIHAPSVHTILHEYLQVHKVSARWVPRQLTDEQKEGRVEFCQTMLQRFDEGRSRNIENIITGDETWIYMFDPETKRQSQVWLFPGETPPLKFKRSRSVGKKMVATFFSSKGHVATIPVEDRRTVNADWYVNQCIPSVLENWRKRRPKTGTRSLLWHHDNASPHKAAATVAALTENKVKILPHPPYSPDLAPCDFFLFPFVKERLRGIHFESPEAAVHAYEREISTMEPEIWHNCFNSWFSRMKLCIQARGEYFEKL